MLKTAALLLSGVGETNPASVEDYIKYGGFKGIRRAVAMTDREILDEIKESALLGKGGASYPTGRKWEQLYNIEGDPKYVVCNADEGEPGTYKDRELIKHAPLRIIEGMLIAGYLFKAKRGIIYIRGEYRNITDIFAQALENAQKAGYLGKNIMGMEGFDYTITIVNGAGSYVCGENSALLNSIESLVSRPRIKPPHLAEVGLYSKPTLVNNVESYAGVAVLMNIGAQEFKSYGTSTDGGTKLISLSTHIKNRKTYEIRIGTSLRDIVFDEELGGGIPDGKEFKFLHIGGQAGPLCFPEQLDTRYCYEELKDAGLTVGSGAIAVMDETVCLVDYVKHVMSFFAYESCGKCTPCRIGTTRILELLTKFTTGKAVPGDLDRLEDLSIHVARLSLCGLGQAASTAMDSALKYRRDEFIAHTRGVCPAGTCKMD
ncbi:complex I 51 kDa subunit family protein [Parasporobacterium paucivorans]|uniref:NADH-quinone oxidoreductase subunit F n=1 Tax=Parasporobacterium paucivorans DSM 15970 TaxID=1122934 RepID=A0A1M6ETS6_9FIRM|nr:NADH-ubiquinone oxidoreductase-F iron-sulfur binding region domain-containing protein [Parasporobacterium paucivorans]SHI88760.1 NADH-quinone oxidoreductase subunit F [Parasporobacterium paucivorans DSM 15970]